MIGAYPRQLSRNQYVMFIIIILFSICYNTVILVLMFRKKSSHAKHQNGRATIILQRLSAAIRTLSLGISR